MLAATFKIVEDREEAMFEVQLRHRPGSDA